MTPVSSSFLRLTSFVYLGSSLVAAVAGPATVTQSKTISILGKLPRMYGGFAVVSLEDSTAFPCGRRNRSHAVPRQSLPAFGEKLSDEEAAALLSYVWLAG
jgi:hypothetical protein